MGSPPGAKAASPALDVGFWDQHFSDKSSVKWPVRGTILRNLTFSRMMRMRPAERRSRAADFALRRLSDTSTRAASTTPRRRRISLWRSSWSTRIT